MAQNKLFIPSTLTGEKINLQIQEGTTSFLTGQKTSTNGYNGNYLGPTLILEQGETVELAVTNKLSDTTTTHWHGLHIAPENDGGPHSLILPNETWRPKFKVMDHAATYWYHPHLHTKTGEQVMKGAAGMIIVGDNEEQGLNLPRKYGVDDFPLIVQTQQFNSTNQVEVDGMRDSINMVNGTINPFVEMPAQVVRLRILNADQERNYNFGFSDDKKFYVIGSDGGLLPSPLELTRIKLAPGERVELLLDLTGMKGSTLDLYSYASEIKMGVQGGPTMKMPNGMPMEMMNSPLNGKDFSLLEINVMDVTSGAVTTIVSKLVDESSISESSATNFRTIRFTPKEDPTPMEAMDGPFFFNDSTFNMERVDQKIDLNAVEIWTLVNMTMVAHPFHIHDVQFHILDINGEKPSPEKSGRKDVVSVGPKDTVRFIAIFEDFVGLTPYMYHCHNLMHEDGGMMGQFTVLEPTSIEERSSLSTSSFSIYPNPSANKLIQIVTTDPVTEAIDVVIYDYTGKVIFHQENSDADDVLDLRELGSGIYIVEISDGISIKRRSLVLH